MNKDDDLNSEKMVEKCCSCVGWGLRSGTTKRWARPTLTVATPFRHPAESGHLKLALHYHSSGKGASGDGKVSSTM